MNGPQKRQLPDAGPELPAEGEAAGRLPENGGRVPKLPRIAKSSFQIAVEEGGIVVTADKITAQGWM